MERREICRFYDPERNFCFWRPDLLALQKIASGQIALSLTGELEKVPTGAFSEQEYRFRALWCSASRHNNQQVCDRYIGENDRTPLETLLIELELSNAIF